MVIGDYMKVSFVDSNELNDDLIKKIFFNTEKKQYDYADYLIIYGCHIKTMLDERLNHALAIIKNKKVGKIVLTGGIGVNGNFNESEYNPIAASKKILVLENSVSSINGSAYTAYVGFKNPYTVSV